MAMDLKELSKEEINKKMDEISEEILVEQKKRTYRNDPRYGREHVKTAREVALRKEEDVLRNELQSRKDTYFLD